MSIDLTRLFEELVIIIQEPALEGYFVNWLNDAMFEIATDFDLPTLRLLEPVDHAVVNTSWLSTPPAAFHKKLFRAADSDWNQIYVCDRWEELDAADISHQDTGDHVTMIAATEDGVSFGHYPLVNETIKLWFYQKPTEMTEESHEPTCIPEQFRIRVLIPKVVVKNFKLLQDMMVQPPIQSLLWWEEELRRGLYGSPRGDIGMINFFAKARPPKRHGGKTPLP